MNKKIILKQSDEIISSVRDWLNLKTNKDYSSIESAIIGAILIEPEKCLPLIKDIQPDYFFNCTCREIFGVILDLNSRQCRIDLPIVCMALDSCDVTASSSDAIKMTECIGNVEHIERHICVLTYLYYQRQISNLIINGLELINKDANIDDIVYSLQPFIRPILDKYTCLKVAEAEIQKTEYEAALETFEPHYLVRGNERHKVYMSKYKPYNGYVWFNGKPVKEDFLLKAGFKKVFE